MVRTSLFPVLMIQLIRLVETEDALYKELRAKYLVCLKVERPNAQGLKVLTSFYVIQTLTRSTRVRAMVVINMFICKNLERNIYTGTYNFF